MSYLSLQDTHTCPRARQQVAVDVGAHRAAHAAAAPDRAESEVRGSYLASPVPGKWREKAVGNRNIMHLQFSTFGENVHDV